MDCYNCENFLTARHLFCGRECVKDGTMTESELQKMIIDTLKAMGGIVFRMNSGRSGRNNVKLCPAGTPDILAVLPHKTLWIEVKAKGGKLRQSQEEMHAQLQQRGQTVIAAYSLDDVLEAIR